MIVLDGITLPDMFWEDEFQWSEIASTQRRTIMGRLVIHETELQENDGRPITLFAETSGIQRYNLKALYEMTRIPDHIMNLSIHDTVYNVMFRHWDAPVIEVSNPVPYYIEDDNLWYNIKMKFVAV